MRMLLVGHSGYIGSKVAKAMLFRGHTVTGLARGTSGDTRKDVTSVVGDLRDIDLLTSLARDSDAVVIAADVVPSVLGAAVDALVECLTGTSTQLALLADSSVHGDTGPGGLERPVGRSESAASVTQAGIEARLLSAAGLGVCSCVVHASLVYGARAGAIPTALARDAADRGSVAQPGDGSTIWSAVHVWDLATLLCVAAEIAPAGSDLHAAAFDVTTAHLALGVAAALGMPGDVRSLSAIEVETALGRRGKALLTNQRFFGQPPRRLGWAPGHVDLHSDLLAEGLDVRGASLAAAVA